MFIGLLTSIARASNHNKCVALSNQKCMTPPTLISLHHNKYSQKLSYYLVTVNLDRCAESCNSLDDMSSSLCPK